MTWIKDPNLASDPAPQNVWLVETSSATWTAVSSTVTIAPVTPVGPVGPVAGPNADNAALAPPVGTTNSASDGLGDPAIPIPNGGTSATSNEKPTDPKRGWHKWPVSNGIITIERTITATASATATPSGQGGSFVLASASLGPYSISVHAHPYNFRLTVQNPGDNPVIDNPGGKISFAYSWNSTSGSIKDINPGSLVYEHLEDSGLGSTNPPNNSLGPTSGRLMFLPKSPPFDHQWLTPQMTDPAKFTWDSLKIGGSGMINAPATDAGFVDTHSLGGGFIHPDGWVSGTFDVAQQYRYYCADPDCPEHIAILPGNHPNRKDDPLVDSAGTAAKAKITRAVVVNTTGGAAYTCVKSIAPSKIVNKQLN